MSDCAPILWFFSAASDGATANRHILDCIFGQFLTSLRKDSVANYASIWTLFSPTVTGLDAFYNAVNVSYFRLVPQDSQICGGNCPKRKEISSRAELCQILYMVTIKIVINSTCVMGIHVTISCRYFIAFEVMMLSGFYFYSAVTWPRWQYP